MPPLDLPDGERERLEEYVREVLVGGYVSRAELAEYAEDYLATAKRRPVSPEQARALADRLWLERVAEQAEWQGETDPERITRAFTALRESGITARENFTCCSTCGDAEIGDAGEPGARGYVYFHTQCTDAAAAGHGLTLFYGGFDDSRETAATVGREVVAALEAVGLRTEWDGDPDWAIVVTPWTGAAAWPVDAPAASVLPMPGRGSWFPCPLRPPPPPTAGPGSIGGGCTAG